MLYTNIESEGRLFLKAKGLQTMFPLRHPISLFAYFLCLSSSSWNKFTGILKGKQEVSRLQRGHVYWINEWQFFTHWINSGSQIFVIPLTKYMHPWLFFDELGTLFVYESLNLLSREYWPSHSFFLNFYFLKSQLGVYHYLNDLQWDCD